MSRIGKQPIVIPETVEVKLEANQAIVKGPKGEQTVVIMPELNVEQKPGLLEVAPTIETKDGLKKWGLQRTLLANAIEGVTNGFSKTLEVNGVGFRVALQGQQLTLSLGFSHPVEYTAPDNIELKVEKNTIIVSGADKQQVGSVAAAIREFKKPEPYKGKGIKYSDEVIRRKAGKAAVKAAG